jgi:hypothetical protein
MCWYRSLLWKNALRFSWITTVGGTSGMSTAMANLSSRMPDDMPTKIQIRPDDEMLVA